ncbi:uncharacterized protein TrAFT101_006062 [Trichoderma asperellum]|uniref:Terpene synthase n=1 Tax=Trichoderma asperellum (strain ATCC 204424 / CBS 433.97 / NBRC 101777) TaxID=1042311 RepID=A0A2T3Z7W4_TRIA4|nr:hypothetical protein M441DRAFT_69334 [Trichoderma asperellum CBS 433.97]PTB40911.1 hypothetical protein M441DRAFT_69334 [Trichoderma asperellum CBS 433.97]UKZ91067.1 hypothetical protein TrAFT101_006062 [Trichoderma asperellum]
MASVFHNLLSQPQFDSLDFADVRCLTEREKADIVECLDAALLSFLSEINFSHRFCQNDSKLRDDLWSWSRENLSGVCICEDEILKGILDEAAAIVEYYYPHAHHDTRLQMAISMAAGLTADDGVTPAASREAFAKFHYDLWCGMPDSGKDEWSKMYLNVIRNFARHFGASDPRMGTIGANGLAGFAEATFMEDSLAMALPPHFSQAQPGMDDHGCCPDGFAYFFRSLSGVTGPLMLGMFKPGRDLEVPLEYWITSIVPLTTFINLINDLLSFPKEMLAGEAHNYMSLQTQAKRQGCQLSAFAQEDDCDARWTFRDTICETMDLLCDAIRSLDRAFIQFHGVCLNHGNDDQWSSELASQVWKAFRNGIISWHINRPRYGLGTLRRIFTKEILITE